MTSEVAQIRERVVAALGSELGDYSRPSFPPAKAIFVGELPAGYKVIRAGPEQPWIPALEVAIKECPRYLALHRNFESTGLKAEYYTYLIFHDRRQPSQPAIEAMVREFKLAPGDPAGMASTDLAPEQYLFRIIAMKRLAFA